MSFSRIPFQQILVRVARDSIPSAIPAWLNDFVQADNKARGALLATLRSYADNDMNVLQTAKTLSRHPNTIYARMQKIEDITGKNALGYHALTELLLAATPRRDPRSAILRISDKPVSPLIGRDSSYADSGMIPWLLVVELMSKTGHTLSELVGKRIEKYPASGEINRQVRDADETLQKIHDCYAPEALATESTDGYSFEYADWRFNIRKSNTEPVIRLNVESRADEILMRSRTNEILGIIEQE